MVGTQEQIDPDSEVVKSIRFATRYTKGKAIYSTVLLGGPNAEALTDFFGLKSVSEEVQVCKRTGLNVFHCFGLIGWHSLKLPVGDLVQGLKLEPRYSPSTCCESGE